MRPWQAGIVLVSALALTAGVAAAEEILHFANGTSMPIRSHEVRGEMIHVDLGGNALMAFPLRQVEKIEEAGKSVVLEPSLGGGSGNRIARSRKPDPSGSYPATGQRPASSNPSRASRENQVPGVEVNEKGDSTASRPFGSAVNPTRRRMSGPPSTRGTQAGSDSGGAGANNRRVIAGKGPQIKQTRMSVGSSTFAPRNAKKKSEDAGSKN